MFAAIVIACGFLMYHFYGFFGLDLWLLEYGQKEAFEDIEILPGR